MNVQPFHPARRGGVGAVEHGGEPGGGFVAAPAPFLISGEQRLAFHAPHLEILDPDAEPVPVVGDGAVDRLELGQRSVAPGDWAVCAYHDLIFGERIGEDGEGLFIAGQGAGEPVLQKIAEARRLRRAFVLEGDVAGLPLDCDAPKAARRCAGGSSGALRLRAPFMTKL